MGVKQSLSRWDCSTGIAPVRKLLDSGVNVGVGVDGTASNDSGHLLAEVRLAFLLQRASGSVGGEVPPTSFGLGFQLIFLEEALGRECSQAMEVWGHHV